MSASGYNFYEIEKKWQTFWETRKTFKAVEDNAVPKSMRRYILDMFPYPSGAGLHVGHPEGYTATDIYCRYLRMNGYNVLHPMGFDAFGLPAENYAIQTGTHPEITTAANIGRFTEQIKSLGFSYDWDRNISSHHPKYYKWTQWIFLQLYKKGLAYEAKTPINWCPKCQTGLANEEVKDGGCERCNTAAEKKNIRQWILKITAYAQRLLDDMDDLDWPDAIKAMQRNWIGRSEGADVRFRLDGASDIIEVYTTRADTLFGATYMVLAPEHPLVQKITTAQHRQQIEDYIQTALKKSDLERTDLAKDKSGVFTGAYAINPVNDASIPIWVSDYILVTYGTGAIMAVPAHDQRDWEFAKMFDLPIIEVLSGGDITAAAFTGDGPHINSGFLNGLDKPDAIRKMIAWLEERKLGQRSINFKLKDWVFSRQRYWGEPIPLIHCNQCGIVPVPEDQLPLILPEVDSYHPSGSGESPLANISAWVNTRCPKCSGEARRETNTMPQWAGSCWYYLRFLDPHNDTVFVGKDHMEYWMPVDLYVGGAEHAVLHLLYARFWHKVLYDLGFVNTKEPFKRLINQGMITAHAFQRQNKSLVPSDAVKEIRPDVFVEASSGERLQRVIAKMSKSLKNVINPDDIIRQYGADSMRMYEMFMGPLEVSKPWSTNGLTGIHRFLNKVWNTAQKPLSDAEPDDRYLKLLHKTIKKVSLDTANLEFNTAIAQMMIFINDVSKLDKCYRQLWEPFVLLISAYAPHLGEEMWETLGNRQSLAFEQWPPWIEALTQDDEIEIVAQINGKIRAKIQVSPEITAIEMEKAVMALPRIQTLIKGRKIVKIIAVPAKLVNIVLT